MTIKNLSYTAMMFAGAIALAGCPGDDTAETNGETDDPTTGSPTTTPSTSAPTTTTTPTTGMTEPTTGETDTTGPDSDTEPDTSTGPDPNEFQFRTDPPDSYTQIDRMGLPAVTTGLIIAGDKDAYNAGTPDNDADDYLDDFNDSLSILHEGDLQGGNPDPAFGLDDDLEGLGLTPCSLFGAPDCDEQLVPLIPGGDQVPVNTAEGAGFPNGRQPQEPVIDGVLAVLLLDLAGGTHTGAEFYAVPLNPLMNDAKFPGAFPWFAPANP